MYRQGAPVSIGSLSLPNITAAPRPAPAPVNGQVMCSTHKKTRGIRFVQQKPVYNAEGTIVAYAYACTDDSPCIVSSHTAAQATSAIRRPDEAVERSIAKRNAEAGGGGDDSGSDFDIDGPSTTQSDDGRPPRHIMKKLAATEGVRTTTTGGTAAGAGGLLAASGGALPDGLFGGSGPSSPKEGEKSINAGRFAVGSSNAGRAPSRYYDMSKSRGDDDFKKVCWGCGMDSHEKPSCPNLLCRNCHDAQEPGYEGRMNHRCSRVGLSAFVLLDTEFLDNFMAAEEVKALNATRGGSEAAAADALSSSSASPDRKTNNLAAVGNFDEAAFVNPDLLTTRCPRCNQLGHMDCPHPLSAHVIKRSAAANRGKKGGLKSPTTASTDPADEGMQRQLSCCGCAGTDHSGYECPHRPKDHWRERVLNVAVDKLGIDAVRRIVAIDERVPSSVRGGTNSTNNNSSSGYGNSSSSNYNGGSSSSYGRGSSGGGGGFGGRGGGAGSRRPREAYSDDDDDGWSDEEYRRPASKGRRGEHDSGYKQRGNNNSNNAQQRGRRYSESESYSDDFSDYSDDGDTYNDRKRNRSGGRGGGGGGGRGGRSNNPHHGRLETRGGNNNSSYSNSANSSSARGGQQSYQRPGQPQQYSYTPVPQQQMYRAPQPQQQQQQTYSRPIPQQYNSYSAPYGTAAPQQQQQMRYSRPPAPPANSQPGRGAYNKRGFEF